MLTDAQQQALKRAALSRGGLQLGEARILRRLMLGQVNRAWERRASNPERVYLGTLIKSGAVRRSSDGYALSEARRIHPPA